jgi:hypothetical protein
MVKKVCRLCSRACDINTSVCPSCDGNQFHVYSAVQMQSEGSYIVEVLYPVTGTTSKECMDQGFNFQEKLLAMLKDFENWFEGHDFSIERHDGDAQGDLEMYWVFPLDQAIRSTEIVSRLLSFRPGVMDQGLITVGFNDPLAGENE